MRVNRDLELCEGNAVCVEAAPDVFALNDEDKVVLLSAVVAAEDEQRVLRVVRMCPRQALSVEIDSHTATRTENS